MPPLVRLGNLVDMSFLIAWFYHLGIPHGWLILCLSMINVMHTLLNNVLLPLHMVFLFSFSFLGFMNDFACINSVTLL